jgi:hypothetical protein
MSSPPVNASPSAKTTTSNIHDQNQGFIESLAPLGGSFARVSV